MSGPAGRKTLDEDQQLSRARGYDFYIVKSLAAVFEISCFHNSFAVYEPTTGSAGITFGSSEMGRRRIKTLSDSLC